MKKIGEGAHREAFRKTDGTVRKVGENSRLHTLAEVAIWDTIPDELRPHIAKIVDYADDYSWVDMEYVEQDWSVKLPDWYRLVQKFEQHGYSMEYVVAPDLRQHDGTIVLVDYGAIELGDGPSQDRYERLKSRM